MVRPRGRCTGADRPPGFLSFLQGDRATLAGMRKMRKGDKMSRDEYNALKVGLGPIPARGASTAGNAGLTCCRWGPPSPQRKVGGTYDGFIGEWVDVKGKYIEDGARRGDPPPHSPLPAPAEATRAVGADRQFSQATWRKAAASTGSTYCTSPSSAASASGSSSPSRPSTEDGLSGPSCFILHI